MPVFPVIPGNLQFRHGHRPRHIDQDRQQARLDVLKDPLLFARLQIGENRLGQLECDVGILGGVVDELGRRDIAHALLLVLFLSKQL